MREDESVWILTLVFGGFCFFIHVLLASQIELCQPPKSVSAASHHLLWLPFSLDGRDCSCLLSHLPSKMFSLHVCSFPPLEQEVELASSLRGPTSFRPDSVASAHETNRRKISKYLCWGNYFLNNAREPALSLM